MNLLKYVFFGTMVLFLMAGATGCKKEGEVAEGDGEYYIRFKVNGKQKEYKTKIPNNRVNYFYLDNLGTFNGVITGLNNLQDAQALPVLNMINIAVRSKEQIESGLAYQLQTPVPVNGFQFPSIELTYADETGETFGALLLRENYPDIEVGDEATVAFNKIDAQASRGTFSARAYSTVDKEEILITDGEFYLPGGLQ